MNSGRDEPSVQFVNVTDAGLSLRGTEIETGRLVRNFTKHEGMAHCVAFSSDGKHVAFDEHLSVNTIAHASSPLRFSLDA